MVELTGISMHAHGLWVVNLHKMLQTHTDAHKVPRRPVSGQPRNESVATVFIQTSYYSPVPLLSYTAVLCICLQWPIVNG